jgi:hypothetical protein
MNYITGARSNQYIIWYQIVNFLYVPSCKMIILINTVEKVIKSDYNVISRI